MTGAQRGPISDLAMAREFFRFFGTTESFKVLGYLMVYGIAGRRSGNEIIAELQVIPPERTTQWRIFRRLGEFGASLREQGWDLDSGEHEQDVVPLARQIVEAVQ